MRKNRLIDPKQIAVVALSTAAVLCAGGILLTMMAGAQKKDSNLYLSETALQTATSITKEIEGNFELLSGIATFIGSAKKTDVDALIPLLNMENDRNKFRRMAYITPDGAAYIVDIDDESSPAADFSHSDYLEQAFSGQRSLILSSADADTETKCDFSQFDTYTVPVFHDGAIIGALAGSMRPDSLQELVSLPSLHGSGYVHIINSSGELLIRSEQPEAAYDPDNFFALLYESTSKYNFVQNDLANSRSGSVSFTAEQGRMHATYLPLGLNDWFLLSIVPNSAIVQSYTPVIWVTAGMTILLAAIFVAMLLRIRRLQLDSEDTMMRLAYFDDLTGLYNKNRFLLELKKQLVDATEPLALVCLNINDFKSFNETFGYDEGNTIIRHAADVFRRSATVGELYSRHVSDRFCLLLRYVDDAVLRGRLMDMMRLIGEYTEHNNLSYHIVMSCGVLVIPPDGTNADPNLMLDHAIAALNLHKGLHFNNIIFYDEDAHQRAAGRTEIEQEMRAALEHEEFQVYLQPKYSTDTQQIVGAEALIRWQHPKRGLIHPAVFIPIFEENGFITELDLYVLRKVCEQKQSWLRRGLPDVLISVNQSRVLLYQSDYIERLHATLSACGIRPCQVELEITESVLFENQAAMAEIITQLHDAGFRTSMDDFGSGYSSLGILKDLPIDVLKLDRAFFDETADTERGRCIISNVLHMARELSIQTVAEGIETKAQFEYLQSAGCDIIQGFYFSTPLPILEFEVRAFGTGG